MLSNSLFVICVIFLEDYFSVMNYTHVDLKFKIKDNCPIEETATQGRYKWKKRRQL